MGEIEEVIGVVGHPLQQMEGESLTRALFRFQSGQCAQFDAMMIDTVFAPEPWWRITGTKGEITISASLSGAELWLWDAEHRDGKRCFPVPDIRPHLDPKLRILPPPFSMEKRWLLDLNTPWANSARPWPFTAQLKAVNGSPFGTDSLAHANTLIYIKQLLKISPRLQYEPYRAKALNAIFRSTSTISESVLRNGEKIRLPVWHP